jgi:hypothetical protein
MLRGLFPLIVASFFLFFITNYRTKTNEVSSHNLGLSTQDSVALSTFYYIIDAKLQ